MLQLICRRLYASGQYRTVLMYEKQSTKPWFYMLMGGSSVIQLVTWSYLSYYAYKTLGMSENKYFRRWRISATVVSLLSGVFFAVIANMYCLRSVKRLELVRPIVEGHKTLETVHQTKVKFTTFTPFGATREFDVPLQAVHRRGHRTDSHPQLAVKVRGYPLNFYLNKRGNITQTFDTFIKLGLNY